MTIVTEIQGHFICKLQTEKYWHCTKKLVIHSKKKKCYFYLSPPSIPTLKWKKQTHPNGSLVKNKYKLLGIKESLVMREGGKSGKDNSFSPLIMTPPSRKGTMFIFPNINQREDWLLSYSLTTYQAFWIP